MLTNRQRIILMALEDSGGLSAKQLAHHLMLTRRYVRRLVGDLYNAGLIEQTHDDDSKRSPNQTGGKPSLYRITEHGKRALEKEYVK